MTSGGNRNPANADRSTTGTAIRPRRIPPPCPTRPAGGERPAAGCNSANGPAQEEALGGQTFCLDQLLVRGADRSEEHTSELQSRLHLVCRLLLEKKKK